MTKYSTNNELGHFDFTDSYLAEIRTGVGVSVVIDNVKILPDNSCNRDIRTMRCNQLEIKLENGKMLALIQEGNKVYDANGSLMREELDEVVDPKEYKEVFESLYGCEVFVIDRKETDLGYEYRMEIGGDEHLYTFVATGEGDQENWDRFLNVGETF